MLVLVGLEPSYVISIQCPTISSPILRLFDEFIEELRLKGPEAGGLSTKTTQSFGEFGFKMFQIFVQTTHC